MSIIYYIIIGFLAGVIAKFLMPGPNEPSGFILTTVLGIIGAVVGGFIMQHLGYAGSGGLIYTVFIAVIGAVLLTLLLRLVTGNRERNL